MAKSKVKNKLSIRCVIVLVLLVCCVCAGVWYLNKDKDTDMPSGNNQVNPYYDERLDDAIEVETNYCKLYYPSEYKNELVVKYSENYGYIVEFYGSLEGKDEVHLFDICFNSDDGDLLGYFENTGDQVVNVSVSIFDLEFDDSWTEEEKNIIYGMQEERNFVVDSLSLDENYVNPN